jgi:hypothetical protein
MKLIRRATVEAHSSLRASIDYSRSTTTRETMLATSSTHMPWERASIIKLPMIPMINKMMRR